jgi:hypothetical protein
MVRPKPSLNSSILNFWAKTCRSRLRDQMQDHRTTTTSPPPPYHIASSPPTVVSSGVHEIKPQRPDFGLLGHNSPLPLARPNAGPPHHHYLAPTALPHRLIAPDSRFQWRAQNRAPTARFWTFGPQLASPACATKLGTTAPPLPRPHHPTTSPHCPQQSFPAARMKPRRNSLRRARNQAPAAWFLIFGHCPLPPAVCIPHSPPRLFITLHCRLQWRAQNRASGVWFLVFGPAAWFCCLLYHLSHSRAIIIGCLLPRLCSLIPFHNNNNILNFDS